MIYESECMKCGARHEYVRPVAMYLDTPACCGVKTEKRLFTAPAGIADIAAYESPASGKWITSRAERREDFKRTGSREWEGMANERQEAAKQKQYVEIDNDKSIDHSVRTAWQHLPDSKKQVVLQGA